MSETGLQCEGWEGPCDSKNATKQRQRTSYVDDSKNWVILCPECMEANKEHWDYMWVEYWFSVKPDLVTKEGCYEFN